MVDVYFNEVFVGTVDDVNSFRDTIISERRKSAISNSINVFYEEDMDALYINSTKGRARRPLIVVKDGESLLTEAQFKQLEKNEINWSDLVRQGIIEFLDAAEEENCLVAMTKEDLTSEHTHLEINPVDILGYCTSLVPYGNYSIGSKISTGAKNQKQGLGLYASNYLVRMDTDVSLLHYPQSPIVKTIMHDVSDFDAHPSGQNVVVAIMSYEGYNMEDAIIMNKGSIDRGMGRATYYKPTQCTQLRYAGGLIDEIGIPDKDVQGYKTEYDYRLLEDDGIVYTEADVKEGDVIIGKVSPPRFLSGLDEYNLSANTKRESSVTMGHGDKYKVDFVMLTENSEGNQLIQVRLRDERIPQIGDKFTSRYSQKGVIGLLVPEADMPFTASGIVPDLIFTPHGLPSRMTVSHVLELLGAKVGSLAGRYVDATTFSAEPESDLRKELHSLGFKENGTETMYNGQTGEQFKVKIYIGNMYYLRLKHMVDNKIQSRARGPIQLLTRQPTEGKAKEGGLRLGEMEKDTFIAHGASLLLKERFDSDITKIPVCSNCGMLAIYDDFKKQSYCSVCGDAVEVENIEVSYAFKLILDEFKSLGIYPKLNLENRY